jgi:iron(III) transport system permease protein
VTLLAEGAPARPGPWHRLRRLGWPGWASILLTALLLAPVLAVLVNVFAPGNGTMSHLAETVLGGYIVNTVGLAIGTGVGVLVIGAGLGWLVTMCEFPGRRFFEWGLVLPLAVPAYVMAFVYVQLLQYAGPVQSWMRGATGWGHGDYWFPEIRSLGGAIAMLVFVLYPYVYLLARAAFIEQSVCALDVSRTLGCSAWGSFYRVALPLARPAIAAGVALALMEAVADFGVVSYFDLPTFTTGIYRAWFSFSDHVAAAQLSSALLGIVFGILLLERVLRGRSRYHHTSGRYRPLVRYRLRGIRAAFACLAAVLPLGIGFLLPAIILLQLTIKNGDQQFGARYLELARNSVTLAGLAAAIAVMAGFLVALAARIRPGYAPHIAMRVAGLGYAVPGAVIAIGVLLPVTAFDNAIDGAMRNLFGVSTGLILSGSIFALLYAYTVRFLANALQPIEAGLQTVTPGMDSAARTLGRGPLGLVTDVHAPLIWPSLLTAALLVFVDVMKELPATLIMRPFNFDTLAVQAFNLARDERLAEASTPSLTIVAVGLLPVFLLSRAIARGRPGQSPVIPGSDR